MRRLFVILLMCLTPFQGALAALGVYHSHDIRESQSSWLFDSTHDHSSHLHLDHHSHAQSESSAKGDTANDADHTDHHCHSAGCAFILGNFTLALSTSVTTHLEEFSQLNSIDFSESIYRPNWR